MFAGVYSGARVFVTGHTGFKGAWLTAWLTALGAEVTGYALEPPTEPSLFAALGQDADLRHVVADVRDDARLAAELAKARPEVVFHLAAQPLVRLGYSEPKETFATNVQGTVNLLDAARACDSVRAVVIVTSDKCYENPETGVPFREGDPMGGHDPYSASKGCAELATASFAASFFSASGTAAVASARAGNVIGGGDWAADRIVPDCVRALAAGETVLVRNPEAVRPWQHVLEPLAGYLWLAARQLRDGEAFAGPWNFGPDEDDAARPVRWVVDRFLAAWGAGEWATPADAPPQPHEAHHLSLDSAKSRERLGWAPVWDAATAVGRTAAWYRAYYEAAPGASADAVRSASRTLVADDLEHYTASARAAHLAWADDAAPAND